MICKGMELKFHEMGFNIFFVETIGLAKTNIQVRGQAKGGSGFDAPEVIVCGFVVVVGMIAAVVVTIREKRVDTA